MPKKNVYFNKPPRFELCYNGNINQSKTILPLIPLALSLSGCTTGIPTEVTFQNTSGESGSIHTDFQQSFLDAVDNDKFISEQDQETFGRTSSSKPNPIRFSWKYKSDSIKKPNKAILKISEDENLISDVWTYETTNKELDVYNLKVNTTYYFNISLDYNGTVFTSETYSKKVSDTALRNIYIDGVRNVRDIGGYKVDNGVIKQGLLYRSAEYNGTFGSVVSDLGKEQLVNTLGIKSDIDLRRTLNFANPKDEISSISESPLGSTIHWVSLPMYFGGMNIFTYNSNLENIKSFFEYLSDEENYPAIFHCVRGTDRTGALSYALGALLGMSEKDLMKDYLFSNFDDLNSNPLKSSNITGKAMYVYQISQKEGNSLSEKAENYLIDNVGLSKETLDKIKDILIENE